MPRRRAHSSRAARFLVNLASAVGVVAALALLVPAAFGLQRYVITGSSMAGSLDLGSIAFEEVVPVADLRVGDVITYQPPPASGVDGLVTHRIVSIRGDQFRTQGDAVPHRDPWTFDLVADDQPRLSFAVPYAGYVFMALADRAVRMAALSVPAGIIFLLALRQLVQVLRRRPDRAPSATHAPVPSAVGTSLPVGG